MSTHIHHVFFSYARKDNGEDNNHLITRFHDLVRNEYGAFTGRSLRTFFGVAAFFGAEYGKKRIDQGLCVFPLSVSFFYDRCAERHFCHFTRSSNRASTCAPAGLSFASATAYKDLLYG